MVICYKIRVLNQCYKIIGAFLHNDTTTIQLHNGLITYCMFASGSMIK